jgi:plasmid stability protein
MGRPPSPDQDKFIIRLPDGMREQIREAAEANGRSMTAEIVARLRTTFEKGLEGPTPTEEANQTEALKKEIDYLSFQFRALESRIYQLETASK